MPGTKILIKGNHDYWWNSLAKIKPILPPTCHLIQNNSIHWKKISVAGTRLWDVPGIHFDALFDGPERKSVDAAIQLENEKLFERELGRLEVSLKAMSPTAELRIAMVHYPPIGLEGEETAVSRLLEKYKVDICLFGHLHNVKSEGPLFGHYRGIHYYLTACDYLDFRPKQITTHF